jgi:hypothetical protein
MNAKGSLHLLSSSLLEHPADLALFDPAPDIASRYVGVQGQVRAIEQPEQIVLDLELPRDKPVTDGVIRRRIDKSKNRP